jgi:hypothetical protein
VKCNKRFKKPILIKPTKDRINIDNIVVEWLLNLSRRGYQITVPYHLEDVKGDRDNDWKRAVSVSRLHEQFNNETNHDVELKMFKKSCSSVFKVIKYGVPLFNRPTKIVKQRWFVVFDDINSVKCLEMLCT